MTKNDPAPGPAGCWRAPAGGHAGGSPGLSRKTDLGRARGRPRSCRPTPSGPRRTTTLPGVLPRTAVERLLSRRDIPLREKTLWRTLYETAARASEILALNVEDLNLEQRRAPVRSKGGDTEFVYWDTGTAHLLPRLPRLPDGTPRTSGPLFLAARKPVPAAPHPGTSARTPAAVAWATTAPGSCSRSTPPPPPAAA
jgi:integrase